jgi:elongation factor 3
MSIETGSEKIQKVLSIPHVSGISYDELMSNSSDTNYLLAFKKTYDLSAVKQKKNNKFNINLVMETGHEFINVFNKWNTRKLIDVLLVMDECSDTQKLYFLDTVDYLIDNRELQVSYYLIDLIKRVNKFMLSLSKKIKTKAKKVMKKLIKCSNNNDIVPFLPDILKALSNSKNIPDSIEKLASCVFVQNMEFRALSVLLPIFKYGLKYKETKTKRKTCIIIENMCKLVMDPKEIYPLINVLRPLLEDCCENISNPETREVAARTLKALLVSGGDYVGNKYNENAIHDIISEHSDASTETIRCLSGLVHELCNINHYVLSDWIEVFTSSGCSADTATAVFNKMQSDNVHVDEKFIDDEEGADLYSGDFSLAYGTKTLINNTFMHLKRNRFYGLVGPNNCGKTTLMRAIANEQIESFPKKDELKTIFVEHEIQEREIGEDDTGYPIFNTDLCGIDWIMDCCNNVYHMEPKIVRTQVEVLMNDIGFGNKKLYPGKDRAADAEMGVTTYSGGWKMKMQLCAATLMDADILMLDEPTGHLDLDNIKWIKQFLTNFKNEGGSIICTSYDSIFLNEMCTHLIDFQNRKLVMFKGEHGNVLKLFVEKYPEKQGYFELKNDVTKFEFPVPSLLEGKKSTRPILKMKNVSYKYPIRDKPTVMDISLNCNTSSRVAVIGPNGAGKSTAIKLLIGELLPTSGEVWKNPLARIAYVAQHAFQHLEKHITKTATEYIMWRFAGNDDKENVDFKADLEVDESKNIEHCLYLVDNFYQVKRCTTENEKKNAIVLEKIHGKRHNKKLKIDEYEVTWESKSDYRMWVNRSILIALGSIKLVQRFDEKLAISKGLMNKQLTAPVIEKYLIGFGIEPEDASHTLLGSLSGGQKVKIVLAASLWQHPHLIILDEPTNYLDRDGLGALSKAIDAFKGGVIVISHNREFANAVSQEKWIMEKGRLRREGESVSKEEEETKSVSQDETVKDKFGNEIKVNKITTMTQKEIKKEIKTIKKQMKQLRKKRGEDDEEIYELQDKIDELEAKIIV